MSDKNTESVLYVETLIIREKNKIRNIVLKKLNRDKEQTISKNLKTSL